MIPIRFFYKRIYVYETIEQKMPSLKKLIRRDVKGRISEGRDFYLFIAQLILENCQKFWFALFVCVGLSIWILYKTHQKS